MTVLVHLESDNPRLLIINHIQHQGIPGHSGQSAGELDYLRAGQVPLHELTIVSSLSRLPNEYQVNNLNAAVARQLDAQGVQLHLGEHVRYGVM